MIMKHILYFLIAALPLVAVTACNDDDDDLPDVSFTVDFSGASRVGDTIYVAQGDTLSIDAVRVTNNESSKPAIITYVAYFWDYLRVGATADAADNFAFDIYIDPATPTGRHLLELYAPVYAVDKSPAFALLAYDVKVVASADDIPSGGTSTLTATPRLSTTDRK